MRRVIATEPSTSSCRSAITLRISGWSSSVSPKAARLAAWCTAWATTWRWPPDEPIMQSKRVIATISMIAGTPRPSSPTIQPWAPRNSTSEEALETLPILFLRRCTCSGFLLPSSRQRGTRKQLRPPGDWASIRKASHIGADMNHLWPTSS